MGNLRFISLGSGSSGNCIFLGTEKYGILIDVGISQRRIQKLLGNVCITYDNIFGVLLTHAHADHTRGANSISNRLHIPFYSTAETFSLTSTGYRSQYEVGYQERNIITPLEPFEIGEFRITAFELPHDVYNVGYKIEYRDKVFTIATDLGESTDYLNKLIGETDYLVLEANYDYDMLLNGSYPYLLKQRIVGESGHLNNKKAAELIKNYATDRLKRLFLCHLSAHNNNPEIVKELFEQVKPKRTIVEVLPRLHPTLLIEL